MVAQVESWHARDGRSHGDLRPENVLIYAQAPEEILKNGRKSHESELFVNLDNTGKYSLPS